MYILCSTWQRRRRAPSSLEARLAICGRERGKSPPWRASCDIQVSSSLDIDIAITLPPCISYACRPRCAAAHRIHPHCYAGSVADPSARLAVAPLTPKAKPSIMALDYDIEPALPPHAHSAIPSRASKGPSATAEHELLPASSPEKKWHESAAWKKVQDRIPAPIARHARRAVCWLKGGEAPKTNVIAPVLARIQTAHSWQFARLPQLARACLFICAFMLWLVVFGVVLSKNSLPGDIGGFGAPVRLSCTARLW